MNLRKKLGVKTRNVTGWERDLHIPNSSACVKLADIFGVPSEELQPLKKHNNNDKRNAVAIGRRIKSIRTKNGMTVTEFAERVGVWDQTVAQWERGANAPKMLNLLKIAETFDISSDYLIHGIGAQNDKFEGERIEIRENKSETLTSTEKYIISTFDLLSDFDKTRLIGYIDALRDAGLGDRIKTG